MREELGGKENDQWKQENRKWKMTLKISKDKRTKHAGYFRTKDFKVC